jgi:putative transposase
MRGFGNFASAARFCCAFVELRQDCRPRRTTREWVSRAQQRWLFLARLAVLQELMVAVPSSTNDFEKTCTILSIFAQF